MSKMPSRNRIRTNTTSKTSTPSHEGRSIIGIKEHQDKVEEAPKAPNEKVEKENDGNDGRANYTNKANETANQLPLGQVIPGSHLFEQLKNHPEFKQLFEDSGENNENGKSRIEAEKEKAEENEKQLMSKEVEDIFS